VGNNEGIIKLSPKDFDNFPVIFWVKNDLGEITNNELINKADWLHDWMIERDDLMLVKVVEFLGDKANGRHAKLKIVEIPDDVEFKIEEYDGQECVAEAHRTWS
jgi:hypothetical protein